MAFTYLVVNLIFLVCIFVMFMQHIENQQKLGGFHWLYYSYSRLYLIVLLFGRVLLATTLIKFLVHTLALHQLKISSTQSSQLSSYRHYGTCSTQRNETQNNEILPNTQKTLLDFTANFLA